MPPTPQTPDAAEIRRLVAATTELGPITVDGHTLRLRTQRLSDADEWRRIRIADQQRIERAWPTSPLSWADQHQRKYWIYGCLGMQRMQRDGRTLPFVIEVDGRFAGQCSLTWADRWDTAEASIWKDSTVKTGRLAVPLLALALMYDFGLSTLGLARVTGATASDNVGANPLLAKLSLRNEATMASFYDAGGQRRAYELWALRPDEIPEGGLVGKALSGIEHSTDGVPSVSPGVGAGIKALGHATAFRAVSVLNRVAARLQRTPAGEPVSDGDITLRPTAERTADPWNFADRNEIAFTIESAGNAVGSLVFGALYNAGTELEVSVEPGASRRDIATAAVRLAVSHGFGIGLARIAFPVDVDDKELRSAAESAGMQLEGTLLGFKPVDGQPKDHELWAVVA